MLFSFLSKYLKQYFRSCSNPYCTVINVELLNPCLGRENTTFIFYVIARVVCPVQLSISRTILLFSYELSWKFFKAIFYKSQLSPKFYCLIHVHRFFFIFRISNQEMHLGTNSLRGKKLSPLSHLEILKFDNVSYFFLWNIVSEFL